MRNRILSIPLSSTASTKFRLERNRACPTAGLNLQLNLNGGSQWLIKAMLNTISTKPPERQAIKLHRPAVQCRRRRNVPAAQQARPFDEMRMLSVIHGEPAARLPGGLPNVPWSISQTFSG